MIDEFCDWFEGEYDNWQQASSWPSWFAYILLEHKRTGPYTFHCEQKYKHNMEVYRTKDITVEETDDGLICRNPVADLHFFRDEAGNFYGRTFEAPFVNGGYLRSECVLKSDEYIVLDQGFDNSGKQVWGSTHGAFVFKKKV